MIQESLNDMLRKGVEYVWIENELIKSRKPKIEWCLSTGMPKIYIPNSEEWENIDVGLTNLLWNIKLHAKIHGDEEKEERISKQRRVKTVLENNVQIIELAWDIVLTPEQICDINLRYAEGERMNYQLGRHGTLVAGYCFRALGGNVRIERCQDGIYVVRNVIKIPVPSEPRGASGGEEWKMRIIFEYQDEIRIFDSEEEFRRILAQRFRLNRKMLDEYVEHEKAHLETARSLGHEAYYAIKFDLYNIPSVETYLPNGKNIPEEDFLKILRAPRRLNQGDMKEIARIEGQQTWYKNISKLAGRAWGQEELEAGSLWLAL